MYAVFFIKSTVVLGKYSVLGTTAEPWTMLQSAMIK